ncbi:MAG: glycerol-3-phosphate 1-O-acyltransferase PlsY [Deltaproteobacteria bacterium]|nr:glycerol-3-phosphate 1-O-acyltransferase PlsY [Deltaproteobacteria bacterium]
MAAAVVLGGYLCGSVPYGLLVARLRGVDIRQRGSGNSGATNVARSLGKKLGALVLALDAAKGALPVLLVLWLGLDRSVHPFVVTLAGLGAVLGHCYPPWLRFRGGKGVATALGVFAVVDAELALGCVAVFVVLWVALRLASVGSMAAALLLPLLQWAAARPNHELALGIGAAALIMVRHRDNLRRLRAGKEHRV